MALSATDLADIEALLNTHGAQAQAVAELRRRFPTLTVTRCDPSDVDLETPFREWPGVSLYLVDSADHCWKLTADAARATGLVVVAHQAGA